MTQIDIKKMREELGISQEAFAHLLGVTFQTVNRWEKGAFKPSILALEKIIALIKKKAKNERN